MNIKKILNPFFFPLLKTKTRSTQENLKKALQISDQKRELAVFVFDIDSTLFCMKYRTQAIINQALQEDFLLKEFTQYSKKISEIKVTETDWSIVEILSRYGVTDKKLVQKMEFYWRRSFFSNQYLYLDQPYEGAVDFLKKLSKSTIYYLTARNYERLRQGTLKSLNKWGFPLQKESHLIMKKTSKETETDKEYKTQYLELLSKEFESICFFENEPVILNQVSRSLAHVHLFWMNSTHSRREKAPHKALKLSMNYSL